jgi:hypothetical protein
MSKYVERDGNRAARPAVLRSMLTRPRGSARIARLALPFLLAIAVAGCASGGSGTPGPSGSPSPGTSATPAASQAIGHSTDPHTLILRVEQAGGFVPPSFLVTRTPQFSLYGDGTAIYELPADPNAGLAAGPAPLGVAKMNAEQVDALLAFALGAGGLEVAREQYLNDRVMDAPDTVFTIVTDAVTKTVSVQALGIADDPTDPDAPQLAQMTRLYELLADFRTQVGRGNATDAGLYEPTAYRAILTEGAQIGEGLDWPWTDLTLDDFVAQGEFGVRVAVLTPDQAKMLSDAPQGGLFAVGVFGPDRAPYSIALRPLLPDEKS